MRLPSPSDVFPLLIYFQFKHFLADYPLQGGYMLGKFKADWGFVGPLAAHCAVHAAFTALACWYVGRLDLIWLAAMDFGVHFAMDRIKASPAWLGRFQALSKKEMLRIMSYSPTLGREGIRARFGKQLRSNVLFWWSLGFDQLVHHLTDLAVVWFLVRP